MEIKKLTQIQKEFILKAIHNVYTLYDYENTTANEFKETYGVSKDELLKELKFLCDYLKEVN